MKKPVPRSGSLALPALLCCLPLAGMAAGPAAYPPVTRLPQPHELTARPSQVISGRVTDDQGEGLPGVTVLVKGTTTGTSTGADGSFSLDVPDGATLIISSIGYKTQEVPVAGRTTVNVSLATDNQQLNDVVVVGYLTQDRQNLSSAVSSVNVVDAKRAPVATVAEQIQGRTPGVQVTSTGAPGQSPNVVIRGVGTLASGSSPLYVIDGLWTDNIRDLNTNDIEAINVLRDASSTAVYGSRGANGVVIITTRRGRTGAPAVSFNVYGGVQNPVKTWELTGASEWADRTTEAFKNAGYARPIAGADKSPGGGFNPNIDTDWQEELLQSGRIQSYDLAFSGGAQEGSNSSNYLISGSYFNQKGIVIGTDFERYTLRLNSGLRRGRFKLSESVQLSHTDRTLLNENAFIDLVRLLPTIPVYDPNESSGSGYGYGNAANNTFGTNPVAAQQIRNQTQYNNRLQGSVQGEFSIFDFLSYRLNLGVEALYFKDRDARKFGRTAQNQPLDPAYLTETRGDQTFLLAEQTLNFTKSFGDHNVVAVGGYSEQRDNFNNSTATNRTFSSQPDYFFVLSAGSTNPEVGGIISKYTKRSFFGQATYDYKNRYLLTGSFRRDGSSRFDPSRKWGNFWAASAGYRISEEDFFRSSLPAVSNLKLRASYGGNGNDALSGLFRGNYLYQATVNQNANYVLGTGQQIVPGFIQTALASDGIKWEERRFTNFGLDLGLLENRFTLSADYYISKTRDALVNPQLSIYLGNFGGDPFTNVGDLENKGFEFVAGYQDNRKAFTYGISANLTTNDNKVTRLAQEGQVIPGGLGLTRTEVGQPIGSFYLLQFDGIFQSQEEVNNHKTADGRIIQPYASAGDVRYKDVNNDGQINTADRQYVGRSYPKVQYGFNLNAGFKGFDLSAFFQGVGGIDQFNAAYFWLTRSDDPGNYLRDYQPWRPDAPSNENPRLLQSGSPLPGTAGANLQQAAASNATFTSTRFLSDASYLRLKNLQIGYTFPKTLLSSMRGIGSLRVYLTGQNVFTLTDYKGLDPEITGVGPFGRAVDDGSYPNLRTFTGGIQLGF